MAALHSGARVSPQGTTHPLSSCPFLSRRLEPRSGWSRLAPRCRSVVRHSPLRVCSPGPARAHDSPRQTRGCDQVPRRSGEAAPWVPGGPSLCHTPSPQPHGATGAEAKERECGTKGPGLNDFKALAMAAARLARSLGGVAAAIPLTCSAAPSEAAEAQVWLSLAQESAPTADHNLGFPDLQVLLLSAASRVRSLHMPEGIAWPPAALELWQGLPVVEDAGVWPQGVALAGFALALGTLTWWRVRRGQVGSGSGRPQQPVGTQPPSSKTFPGRGRTDAPGRGGPGALGVRRWDADKEDGDWGSGRASQVQRELLRLALQAELEELLDQGPTLLIHSWGHQFPGATGARDAVNQDRVQAVQRIMDQLLELGTRDELMSLPLLPSTASTPVPALLSGAVRPGGDQGDRRETRTALPGASAERALVGTWELVCVSPPEPVLDDGSEGAMGGTPQRVLQQLLEVAGAVPEVSVDGPVMQTISLARTPRMMPSPSQAQQGGLFTAGGDGRVQAERGSALETRSAVRVRLGPIGVVEAALNVAWGRRQDRDRASPGLETNTVSETPATVLGTAASAQEERSEVSVEGLSVVPLELFGTKVNIPALPLFGFPATIPVPGFLEPLRSGHMVVQYIDDRFRIDSDDTNALFLFRRHSV